MTSDRSTPDRGWIAMESLGGATLFGIGGGMILSGWSGASGVRAWWLIVLVALGAALVGFLGSRASRMARPLRVMFGAVAGAAAGVGVLGTVGFLLGGGVRDPALGLRGLVAGVTIGAIVGLVTGGLAGLRSG